MSFLDYERYDLNGEETEKKHTYRSNRDNKKRKELYDKYDNEPERIERLGFKPYVDGLDNALQGGIPKGSWVVLFGNPGSYKTLHSLAFMLNGIENDEKVIYVSTEQDWKNLRLQARTLGWDYSVNETHLTMKTVRTGKNDFDIVWIDLDSLRYLAFSLNRLVREEGKKKKYYWYYDPELMTFSIILGLELVGAVERKESDITIQQVEYMRIKDGWYGSDRAMLKVNRDVPVRIIIDSISVLFTSRWSIAGRVLTDMKIRLEAPIYTFLLTSHVSRSNEEEMGAQVGHVVDGRIRLWNELTKDGTARVTGWIAKMRLTDHSRREHIVSITETGGRKIIKWT